ncbi:MAG TPA: hypothetical protein VIU61_12020 [Kofleriaceae bacterium]
MPGRSAIALGAGFITLFVLALVLKSAASPEPEVTAPASSAPVASAPAEDPWARPAASPAASPSAPGRDPTIAIAPRAPVATGTATPPPSIPSAPAAEPEWPGGKKPRLVANSHLRVQTNEVEPQVRACAERFGGKLSGTVSLTHIVARDDAKQTAKIESSELDPSESTIENKRLVDCLRDTAYEMKFPYVAHGVPVAALRKIVLEKGKLVDYQHVSSARLRD